MSSSLKPILRQQSAKPKTENLSLPKWDKDGNLISQSRKQAKPVKVADVEVASVKPPTVAELEAIREQAYNEGFEQGYEQGMNQGAKKGEQDGHVKGLAVGQEEGRKLGEQKAYDEALKLEQAESQKKFELFDALTLAMTHQLAAEEKELKEAMLALSIRIARQVLQDELKIQPEHIQSIVHAAIQALPNPDEKLTVYVNSNDAEFIRGIAESHWKVEVSDSVSQGGCQVKSNYSYIDYTLEHRFENAVAHLMNHPEYTMPGKVNQPLLGDISSQQEEASESANSNETTGEPDKIQSIAEVEATEATEAAETAETAAEIANEPELKETSKEPEIDDTNH